MTINLHLKKKYLREIDMYMSPRQAYDDEFLKELNWEMSIPSIFPINRNESGKWGKALGHRSNSRGDLLSYLIRFHNTKKGVCIHEMLSICVLKRPSILNGCSRNWELSLNSQDWWKP